MGGRLHRFAFELAVVILEFTQVDVGPFDRQVAVEAITGEHLVAVVITIQIALVGFNAGNTSA
ncbi:hypothetical protein D3C76_1816700 [compost metagenome]